MILFYEKVFDRERDYDVYRIADQNDHRVGTTLTEQEARNWCIKANFDDTSPLAKAIQEHRCPLFHSSKNVSTRRK